MLSYETYRFLAKRIDEWRHVTEIGPVEAPIDVCMQAAKKCMPNVDRLAAESQFGKLKQHQ